MAEKSLFELLREKSILAILDGDTEFGEIESDESRGNIKVSMPYLSGPILCGISTRFGLPVTYGSQSRWVYLDDIWAHCIKNHRESDLLGFLFSKEQFAEKLKGYSKETVESVYAIIVEATIKQINGALYFGGNELVRIGNQFVIRKIGSTVTVVAPTIKILEGFSWDIQEMIFCKNAKSHLMILGLFISNHLSITMVGQMIQTSIIPKW